MKQNEVVCKPGQALLFFIFPFKYLISGPKSYRDFRETGLWKPWGSLHKLEAMFWNRYFKKFKNFCWYPLNLYCSKIQLRIEKLRGPSSNRYCSCYEFAWLQTPVHFLTHAAFIKNEKSKDYCKANSEQRALLFHNNISAGHTSLLQAYTCYCDRCYFYQPFTFWRNTLQIATAWKWRFTQN